MIRLHYSIGLAVAPSRRTLSLLFDTTLIQTEWLALGDLIDQANQRRATSAAHQLVGKQASCAPFKPRRDLFWYIPIRNFWATHGSQYSILSDDRLELRVPTQKVRLPIYAKLKDGIDNLQVWCATSSRSFVGRFILNTPHRV